MYDSSREFKRTENPYNKNKKRQEISSKHKIKKNQTDKNGTGVR